MDEQMKKYIRTLEGDMATLKKGGTPDLVPLPPQPAPSVDIRTAENVTPAPAPAPEIPKPSPLETYASDFSDRMKETEASPVTVLAAQQDAAPGAPQQPEQKSRSGLLYIFAGVMLLGVGGFGVYFAYTNYFPKSVPITITPAIPSPIFVDEREQIFGTGAALLQAIEHSINRPLASGAVRLLYTANATTTDNSVFSALQEPAPDILLRNVNAKDSMAGIVSAGNVQSPFFIISVASYSKTFFGMLSWEPSMPNDLSQLFPPYPAPVIATSTIATSTIATTTTTKAAKMKIATTTATSSAPTIVSSWRDEMVSNHDVRIYRDASGRGILLYGYWNQTTLVIARDPAAFTEIIERLANSQAQQ